MIFTFWYRLENWSYRFARFCKRMRDRSFDRMLERDRKWLKKKGFNI